MNEDGFMFGLMAACGALLAFSFVACTQGIIADNKVRKQLEVDNCSLVSKRETGESLYCGKACTRPEYAYEYICKPEGMSVTARIIKGM